MQFEKLELEANLINSNPRLLEEIYRKIKTKTPKSKITKPKSLCEAKVQKLVACIEQKPLEELMIIDKENKHLNKGRKSMCEII